MLSFHSEIQINASAERVWAILTDAAKWTEWNTTVTRIDGTIALGQKVTVYAKINPARAFPVKVTELTRPQRMVWTGGMPLGLFKGERVFTLNSQAGGTRFVMHEEFTGLMAQLITKSIPDLQPSFEEFGAALKQRAEAT